MLTTMEKQQLQQLGYLFPTLFFFTSLKLFGFNQQYPCRQAFRGFSRASLDALEVTLNCPINVLENDLSMAEIKAKRLHQHPLTPWLRLIHSHFTTFKSPQPMECFPVTMTHSTKQPLVNCDDCDWCVQIATYTHTFQVCNMIQSNRTNGDN